MEHWSWQNPSSKAFCKADTVTVGSTLILSLLPARSMAGFRGSALKNATAAQGPDSRSCEEEQTIYLSSKRRKIRNQSLLKHLSERMNISLSLSLSLFLFQKERNSQQWIFHALSHISTLSEINISHSLTLSLSLSLSRSLQVVAFCNHAYHRTIDL